ncbi:MAG: hypothetical protein ACJAQ6_000565 [Arenicella sp.]|jgi:hypothetical protein
MHRRDFISYCAALAASSWLTNINALADPAAAWSRAAPLPIKIQELYPAVHKGKLYVAGGIASKLGVIYFTNNFVSYDPVSNQWSQQTPLPEDLHHAALVSTGERLFLVGGFNGGYSHIWRMRSQVYEYVEEQWIKRVDLPGPQAEGVVAASNGVIHIVAGQSPTAKANNKRSDHSEVTTHLMWAADMAAWEPAAPIPVACNSATGGWLGAKMIVTGGRTSNGNFDHTHIYDKKEDKWRPAAPLPRPQAGTASVVVDDGIIVFGGEIFTPTAAVFSNVWRYSLTNDQWTALPDLPTPRHGLGAGKIGDQIYLLGGATQPSGNGTTNLNEVFNL